MTRVGYLVALAFVAVTGSASAAVSVMGTGYAKACFEAAESARSLRDALRICDSALLDDSVAAVDRAATFVNRGIVQMQARDYSAAIADYDAAIKLEPATAEAYVNKGIALMRLGHDDEAVAQLSEGIARNPKRPEIAFYNRALAHEGLGKAREAYEDYSRAAQLAPQWAEPAEQLQRFQLVRRKTAAG